MSEGKPGEGSDPATAAKPLEQQQNSSGTGSAGQGSSDVTSPQSGQNGGNSDVSTLVDEILEAGAPSWQSTALAFAILAVGTGASYGVYRWIHPTEFMPSSNYAVYAGLFVMALAIERLLEPFSGQIAKRAANTSKSMKPAGRVKPADNTEDASRGKAQQEAKEKEAKKDVHLSLPDRAVLMWAAASVLAMLACAALGIFLLRSVETPTATGGTTSASAPSGKSAPSGPGPNHVLDLLVTGLVVGAGTKPLHDLISQIQTSSSNSKTSSSATTTS
jgi:hypothetical protein